MEPRKEEEKPKRFRIVKLEDRIVPSHFPAVAAVVVGSPAVDNAPPHAHKVDFRVNTAITQGNCGRGSSGC